MHTGHVGSIYHNWKCELGFEKQNAADVLLGNSQAHALWRADNRNPDCMKVWVNTGTRTVFEPCS